MKTIHLYFKSFCFFMAITSCISCSREPQQLDTLEEGKCIITGETSHISCRNAEISGKANLSGTIALNLSFGVVYSTSSGVLIGTSKQIEAKIFDSDYNFSVNTEVLEPETTYYYRSYIIQNNDVSYGEVKSFKTMAVNSMITTEDATNIHSKDATLNATLDLTDCKYKVLEYGFEITPDGCSAHTVKANNLSQNKFSAEDTYLSKETKCSVFAYVILDGKKYNGDVKTFTTESIKASISVDAKDVKYKTASIYGRLTVESKGIFTKSATLYYSSKENTIAELKSKGTSRSISLKDDGTYSIVAYDLKSNSKNYYVVIAKVDNTEFPSEIKSLTTADIPSNAIDLGLSVLWAKYNIGATKPEEYGTYFAWGDVEGQLWDGSSWSGDGFSSYPEYELDANGNLKPEYDAAYVNLGGNWRMPTMSEYHILRENCTSTWTSDYNGTGVSGRIFTSNKEGYTDKSIFLPAAGYGNNNSLNEIRSYGYYWSSSFGSIATDAWRFFFDIEGNYSYYGRRSYGQPIRPVLE